MGKFVRLTMLGIGLAMGLVTAPSVLAIEAMVDETTGTATGISEMSQTPTEAIVTGVENGAEAETETEVAGSDSWQALKECLEADEPEGSAAAVCALKPGAEITDANSLITISGNKTLDLAGGSITGTGEGGSWFIFDKDASEAMSLNIIGEGTLTNTGGADKPTITIYGSSTITEKFAHLTIASGVKLENATLSIVANQGNNYGTVVDIYGTIHDDIDFATPISISANIRNTENIPVINLHEGAAVVNARAAAILQAGPSTLNIEKATVKGGSGIVSKAGTINAAGGSITGTSEWSAGEARESGYKTTGAAIQVEYGEKYQHNVVISLSGGAVLTSERGNAIQEYGEGGKALESVTLSGDVVLKAGEDKPVMTAVQPDLVALVDGEKTDLSQINTVFPMAADAPEEVVTRNPETTDKIFTYVAIAGVAILGLVITIVVAKCTKKKSKKQTGAGGKARRQGKKSRH